MTPNTGRGLWRGVRAGLGRGVRRIGTAVVLAGLLAIGLGTTVDAQVGPAFSAQIQLALRALLANDQTITGNWTCSGTCTGFGGGGGSSAFNAITGGTNTSAAMVVGTGASLSVTGSGTIGATSAPVSGLTGAGTGVLTALAVNTGSAGAFVVNGGALGTPASGTLTSATGYLLSNLAAAGGSSTLANGDNPVVWNWATTTSGRVGFNVGETTASTSAGTPYLLKVNTLIGSTATPLNVANSLNGSQTLPALSVTPTWNTTGVANGLFFNATNTASNSVSRVFDFQASGASQVIASISGNFGAVAQVLGTGFEAYVSNTTLLASSRFTSGGGTLGRSFIMGSNIGSGVGGIGLAADYVVGWSANNAASGVDAGANPDTMLRRDGAANTIAQRNSTNAQTQRWYETYTDPSNYGRFRIAAASGAAYTLGPEAAGTGTLRSTTFANGSQAATSGTVTGLTVTGTANPSSTSTMAYQPFIISPTINYSNGTPGAGSYEALKIAVTETALPTGTNYLIRASAGAAGTADKFTVDNAGLLTVAGGITASGSFYLGGTGSAAGGAVFLSTSTLRVQRDSVVGWNVNNNQSSGGTDTAFSRNAAGVVEVNNGSAGTYRDIKTRAFISNPVVFASATASNEGTCQWFTDSTTSTYGATITGGGANHVLGCYNGTNWTVH